MQHLRPTRNAGSDHMAIGIERNVFFKLLNKGYLFRSRPDQTHVALEHIDELGNLIQPSLANIAPHTSYTSIPRRCKASPILLRIPAHAAQLIHPERPVALAHPVLHKEHGAIAFELYQHANDEHKGQPDRRQRQYYQSVHNPLDEQIGTGWQQSTENILREVFHPDPASH